MSKKKKLVIYLLMLPITLAALHFTMGILKRHNYFTAWMDRSSGELRIVYYGEPFPTDSLASVWAERHGFSHDRIAGCDVSSPLINGSKMYNQVMQDALDERLGEGWEVRMRREVDSLHADMKSERGDTVNEKNYDHY